MKKKSSSFTIIINLTIIYSAILVVLFICSLKNSSNEQVNKPTKSNAVIGNLTTSENTEYQIINNEELDKVTVTKVIDGDTISCVRENEEEEFKVRFNLIDTPESVHIDESRNNDYGIMASDFTKSLIKEGDTVYLEYDVEKNDIYNRTLAYVWLSDDVNTDLKSDIEKYMANAIILRNGYARVYSFNNVKYLELFKMYESEAKQNKAGLWKYDEYIEISTK